eukprot:15366107-Ditylum_brightwellii.AAC.1
MEGKLRNEQHDLKRIVNAMTVMSDNSKKTMLSPSDEASCTAFKRLQALEEDDGMFDDDDEVDIANQKCNQFISKTSTMLVEKLMLKRKAKAKSTMESDSLIEEGNHFVCLMKDGSKIKLP